MSRNDRLATYKQMLMHIIGFCAALYRLITNEDAPKFKDIL
jgi:hypothetical protein